MWTLSTGIEKGFRYLPRFITVIGHQAVHPAGPVAGPQNRQTETITMPQPSPMPSAGSTATHSQQASAESLLQLQRQAFQAEPWPEADTRIDRINRCIDLLVDHQNALCDAVNADFSCRSPIVTRMTDIGTSLQTLKYVR